MSTLSMLDLGFFLTETDASPKHVGGLMIFRKPSAADTNFVRDVLADFIGDVSDIRAPFDQIIRASLFKPPHWHSDPGFNIDEHVFFHRLKGEDFRDELYSLVGELHSLRLDRSKPMWEIHVIEHGSDRRFAIYTKIHHAYADGVTMSSWIAKSLSHSPRSEQVSSLWSALPAKSSARRDNHSLLEVVGKLGKQSGRYLKSAAGLGKLSTQLMLETVHLTRNAVALPFRASADTPLTGQVTEGRQIATAAVPMSRVDTLRKQTRSTLNHIALTCIDGALHRYLESCGHDIDQPITIQMPVNLREQGDDSLGNKIGIVLVELARRTRDPYERLREIGFTLRNVRYQIDGVPAGSVVAYTMILAGLSLVGEVLKLSDVLPPLGNTLVSNVPGPRQALYLRGARMEEMYPISALTPGNHLNITLYSYDGKLAFGLVASKALPELERLSHYLHDAFAELENAVKLQ